MLWTHWLRPLVSSAPERVGYTQESTYTGRDNSFVTEKPKYIVRYVVVWASPSSVAYYLVAFVPAYLASSDFTDYIVASLD